MQRSFKLVAFGMADDTTPKSAQLKRLPARQLRLITKVHILGAIQMIDAGTAHGFDESDDYDLLYQGRRYPPKAVLGVAAVEPLGRQLIPDDFSGGESSTCFRILREAGFEVVPKELMLSLTTNDGVQDSDWGWKDVLGESYHFPNQYRNMIIPGRQFIYYHGVKQGDGKRRDAPEYFGRGTIGVVTRDDTIPTTEPKAKWAWYATIEGYELLPKPVSWKDDQGRHFEQIPVNMFRNGVRKLRPDVFAAILKHAGVATGPAIAPMPVTAPVPPPVIPIANQLLVPATGSLFLLRRPTKAAISGEGVAGRVARSRWRQHKRATDIGRRGEQLVWDELRRLAAHHGWQNLEWPASESLTPGWDMHFTVSGKTIAVEVKSTTLPAFPDVEITANEWAAAQRLGDDYWLVLVTDVEKAQPCMQWVRNPWALVQHGVMSSTPMVLSLTPEREILPVDLVRVVGILKA